MTRFLHPRIQGRLLLLVVAALFWPGLGGDFLLDDYPSIVSNDSVHATQINAESLTKAARAYEVGAGLNRPLATMWFAVDYYLGGGKPWIFKFNGLLVHLVNALLVFLLLQRLFGLAGAQAPERRIGHLTCVSLALVWAIHPLQVSTVLYVVQRMETLSLSFVLMGLLAYIAGRQRQIAGARGWPYFAACLPLFGLALASKESAILFPAYTLSLELTVLGFAAQSPQTARRWRWCYGAAGVLGVLVFAFWVVPHYATAEAYAIRDFSVWERLLTQCRVLPMYLGQMLLPLPQSMTFYYDDYALSRSLLDPLSTLPGALLLLALLGSAIGLRRRMPVYALGILWFFAAHFLTSNVVALELIFEHRNYFALLGIVIAVYDLVTRIPLHKEVTLLRALPLVLLLSLAALTLLRSATWGDPFLLAVDLVAKKPQSVRAGSDLATLYFGASHGDAQSPQFAAGIKEFERVASMPGASPIPDQGLIVMLTVGGRPVADALWERMIAKLQTRTIASQELMSVTGLLGLAETGRAVDHRRVAQACAIVLARSRQRADMYVRCGFHALRSLKDEALAERLMLQALQRSPEPSALASDIARILIDGGHQRMAEVIGQKARELQRTMPK